MFSLKITADFDNVENLVNTLHNVIYEIHTQTNNIIVDGKFGNFFPVSLENNTLWLSINKERNNMLSWDDLDLIASATPVFLNENDWDNSLNKLKDIWNQPIAENIYKVISEQYDILMYDNSVDEFYIDLEDQDNICNKLELLLKRYGIEFTKKVVLSTIEMKPQNAENFYHLLQEIALEEIASIRRQ